MVAAARRAPFDGVIPCCSGLVRFARVDRLGAMGVRMAEGTSDRFFCGSTQRQGNNRSLEPVAAGVPRSREGGENLNFTSECRLPPGLARAPSSTSRMGPLGLAPWESSPCPPSAPPSAAGVSSGCLPGSPAGPQRGGDAAHPRKS